MKQSRCLFLVVSMTMGCAPAAQPPQDASIEDAAVVADAAADVSNDRVAPQRFAGLSERCWRSPLSECNPANNEGCPPGRVCDLARNASGNTVIACVDVRATATLGAACSYDSGPYCIGGLRCSMGRCADTCCSDAECAAGQSCVPLDSLLGSLGVCRQGGPPPPCAPAGEFCRTNSDCCSNDCHDDHCH
ncbi:MAG: hypothetical protein JNK05_24035 [Myxococcales bacterium]|nr:hypothetical protein [Myxococcales bacterium]